MNFIKRLFFSLVNISTGLILIYLGLNVSAYFSGVPENVLESIDNNYTKQKLGRYFIGAAKPSLAQLMARSSLTDKHSQDYEAILQTADKMRSEKPAWIVSGGEEPFFSAIYSTLGISNPKEQSVYEMLASADSRNMFRSFLKQSEMPIVKDILSLNDLNTYLLPSAATSAGAPYEAAVLINALLAQSGAFNTNCMRDLAADIPSIKINQETQIKYENFCLSLLSLAKRLDWIQLAEISSKVNSIEEFTKLGTVLAKVPNDNLFDSVFAGLFLTANLEKSIKYLSRADENKWIDFATAAEYGSDSLNLLLERQKPIYTNPSYLNNEYLWEFQNIKAVNAFAGHYPLMSIFAKMMILLLGCAIFMRGFFRLMLHRDDTQSWYSPISLFRLFFSALFLLVLIVFLVEPNLLSIPLSTETHPQSLRFTITSLTNIIGENKMNLNLTMPTLVALILFFIIQLIIFAFGMAKLFSIKRMSVSSALKLELLDNEDNLFDLGLYVGLLGTVTALMVLSFNLIDVGMMAGYSSTLLGIIFTATLKIAFLRPIKRRFLLESERGK